MTFSWEDAIRLLDADAPRAHVRFARHLVPHPLDAQFHQGLGVPVGQRADFFKPLPDGRGLHVQDFDEHYEAHLDSTEAGCDDLVRAVGSGPALAAVVGLTAIGGLTGLLLGRSKEATVVGALIGAAVGGATALAVDLDVMVPLTPSSSSATRERR